MFKCEIKEAFSSFLEKKNTKNLSYYVPNTLFLNWLSLGQQDHVRSILFLHMPDEE